jgi:hypothetical protein
MERRTFLGASLAAASSWTVRGLVGEEMAMNEPFVLSENGSSRATGYAESNKVVTLDGKTHVAWLDSADGAFWVRIRTLDRVTGEWSPTYTVGNAHDNHGGPALAADSKGYLHIVYYPHHHPFRYRRSARPNDASAWGEEVQFGDRCTYPTLVIAPDDTLVLTCRESNREGKPWVVNRYLKSPGKPWSAAHAIMVADEGGYSHFQDAMAWSPDRKTIHLSTRMYGGTPGRPHTVAYMRSHDLGETWEDATGTPIALPATSKTCTVLDSDSAGPRGLRCGAVAVAPDGTPMVLYSDTQSLPNQAWLVRLDPETGKQERQALQPFADKLIAGASVAMPGGLSVDGRGRIHVVLTTALGRRKVGWGSPFEEIVYLVSPGFGEAFAGQIISSQDASVAHWLPNIERDTGHHPVTTRPAIMFLGGGPGGKNTEVVSNRVHWW